MLKKIENKNVKPTIAVRYLETKILKLEHLFNTHFSCVEIMWASTRFYLVSVQYSEPTGHYLQQLESIVQALQDREFVMCLDANATSTTWDELPSSYSGITDSSEELKEFIAQHRLVVLKRNGNAPTLVTQASKQ